MLAHCDFVYAGESAKFQLPFVNLALVPEFGSSYLLPLRFGYVCAADETARTLAEKPSGALQACKRLMRRTSHEQLEQAVTFEKEEFAVRVRSAEAKQAFTAFLEKHAPAYDR